MKPRFNRFIWFGFVIVVASAASYLPIFAVYPSTRDVPWVNYALFLAGGALLAIGLQRAFRDQEHYRGKLSGSLWQTPLGNWCLRPNFSRTIAHSFWSFTEVTGDRFATPSYGVSSNATASFMTAE